MGTPIENTRLIPLKVPLSEVSKIYIFFLIFVNLGPVEENIGKKIGI